MTGLPPRVRLRAPRCPDGFYPGCCPNSDCAHYDGTGEGAAPVEPRYLYCRSCEQAIEPGKAVASHTTWLCPDCALCVHCKTRRRPKQSRFCRECFAMLSAPKPCAACREPIYCRKPEAKNLYEHMRREKHHGCSLDYARATSRRTFL